MKRSFMTTRDLMLSAMFVALLAIGSQLSVPVKPLPVTLQTLVVMLTGALLGKKRGPISVLVFIGLAAVGAPILSGGAGGIAHLVGPTAGYIWAFPIAAFLVGLFIEQFAKRGPIKAWQVFISCVLGSMIIVHTLGFTWLLYVTGIPINKLMYSSLLPFLPWDAVKALIATIITMTLYRAKPDLQPKPHKKENKSASVA